MSQIKPILNPNSNFEFGDTTGFTEALTGATAAFLDRQDERGNEKRQVFPPLLKSRSDYIYNGRFSRRYNVEAGGNLTLTMDSVPVDPGMMVSTNIVYRVDTISDAPGVQIQLDGTLDDATSVTAVRDFGPAPNRYISGQQFNYRWDPTADTVNLSSQGSPAGVGLWYRVGLTVEIAQGLVSMEPVFLFEGQAAAATVIDVGEFSIQALDSRIHAGG